MSGGRQLSPRAAARSVRLEPLPTGRLSVVAMHFFEHGVAVARSGGRGLVGSSGH